ncbi:WD repeat domain-containing protein [Colletotrichum tofieldiae]|uniref:WD repeat domain-containing protein n=1 Tax=Colletotrichum tofieldiae TaxID=708197 RepID=A0A166YI57_9PEZI|nr:WD repeat domain-containing protein [Colletotrichum tofieldiae]GKT61788.1 WD repeat domain-containing protein [Colletotrichum tofieldiae]GKT70156.1 WD repeat domain-containing protein [Colletotrichum tofieldiae]GKT93202.1 WD repeat domain-containing protein [Colletotrichum tofieldiae]
MHPSENKDADPVPHRETTGPAKDPYAPPMDLVATTAVAGRDPAGSSRPTSFFRGVRWTADGTTLVASTSDNRLSAYVLPADLLDPNGRPRTLTPQGQLQLPEPFYSAAVSPYFSLSEPQTQLALLACKDHPIQLYRVFSEPQSPPPPLCSYKLIRRETEEYICPESLLWSWPGTHFLAGSTNRLDHFDVSRTGSDGPVLTIPTIPSKRHLLKGGGVGMKGMVSALSSQIPDDSGASIVAAGTWSRWMGLYDVTRTNKPVANWSIHGVTKAHFGRDVGGNGIVQTIWSPCGRYLAINERQASGILVYDVRGTGQPLNLLVGRATTTQQRLTCDVFPGSGDSTGGFELWAGTETGTVLVYEDVGARDGVLDMSWDWAAHSSPVGSTGVHPTGSVVATCSGAWTSHADRELDNDLGCTDGNGQPRLASTRITLDSSLKVWTLAADTTDHSTRETPDA